MKVKVEEFNGKLRLRWTYPKGQRPCINLGWDDTPINAKQAEMRARAIERDILDNKYDFSLDRYRPSQSGGVPQSLTVLALMEKFVEHKAHDLRKGGLQKYQATTARAKEFFSPNVKAESIGLEQAAKFREWLKTLKNNRGEPLSNVTIKERLQVLSSCWTWAEDEKLLTGNPWKKASRQVKKEKSKPQPLKAEEIAIVVAAYRSDAEYSYYADLVTFLLGTGARFGEVACLTWDDVSEECDRVLFDKSFSRGELSPTTKNEKTGWVRLSSSLQKMLRRRQLSKPSKERLIFPSRRSGESINDRVFRNSWVHILRTNNIPYRKPYSTRATLISHWLAEGEDIATVAEMTRTSVKMIQEHYAASIKTDVVLPDLFND